MTDEATEKTGKEKTSSRDALNEQEILRDHLWDSIAKYIADHMTSRLLPLINEQFKKHYPKDTPIRLMQTEYTRFVDEMKPSAVLCDITILVNEKDIYHLECQMTNDGEMVIRMIEYDLLFSLRHGKIMDPDGNIEIHFPQSTVIYPASNSAIPKELSCTVVFPDQSRHTYRIPTMRIQDYSLEDIAKKHLDFFLPFTLLRFVPRLKSKTDPLTKNELTEFVEKINMILDEEYKAGEISEEDYKTYHNLIRLAVKKVFIHKSELAEEVGNMTPYKLETLAELTERLYREDIARLESEVAEQQTEIEEQRNEIEEQRNEIEEQRNALTEKDNTISKKERELKHLREEIKRLKNS